MRKCLYIVLCIILPLSVISCNLDDEDTEYVSVTIHNRTLETVVIYYEYDSLFGNDKRESTVATISSLENQSVKLVQGRMYYARGKISGNVYGSNPLSFGFSFYELWYIEYK